MSFDVRAGSVVGVIGRNGAGKSTLLKILSRITEPTTGRVEIAGRVGSLLEVGTGFHPELTGRENILLNGAILGMRRHEVSRKFDEIVSFAEMSTFLDTPVKRYSSGMYMRLAFSVAAHLETDILLVDEVLAVGDAEFQKKCLGKMEDVAHGGRTVLFVSHNIGTVLSLCERAILLAGGSVAAVGSAAAVVETYADSLNSDVRTSATFEKDQHRPRMLDISIPTRGLRFGDSLPIDLRLFAPGSSEVAVELEIHDARGIPIAYTSTAPLAGRTFTIAAGEERSIRLEVGPLTLAAGRYYLSFWLMRPWMENYHIANHAVCFEVDAADPCSTGFEFRQSYGRGAVTFPLRIFDRCERASCA